MQKKVIVSGILYYGLIKCFQKKEGKNKKNGIENFFLNKILIFTVARYH